jgi:uncharacterized protein RhaS with RHS repeats
MSAPRRPDSHNSLSENPGTIQYDALGRATDETNALGHFITTYVGTTPRPEHVTYPNGQTTTYAYYPNSGDHRLQTIHHKYPTGSTLSKFDYTYDSVGNILTWTQQADSAAATIYQYGYDATDQLTSAVQATADLSATLKRYAYSYDPAGNRLSEQIDDALVGASYDALNRLVSQQPVGALRVRGQVSEPALATINGKPMTVAATGTFDTTVPITTATSTFAIAAIDGSGNQATNVYEVDSAGASKFFTYDANGSVTSDGETTFEWDGANRLTAVIMVGQEVSLNMTVLVIGYGFLIRLIQS